MAVKVAINGLGRIGRCVARIVANREDVELVAVNASGSEEMIQYNLRYDTVHGPRQDIKVEVSNYEINQLAPSYSVNTVSYLKNLYNPSKIF